MGGEFQINYKCNIFNTYIVGCHVMIDFILQVTVKDLPTNTVQTQIFDAIFVCNGHNSVPFTPDIQGINEFQGHVIHSHDYRRADSFKGYHHSYRIDFVSGSNELFIFQTNTY